MQRGEGGRSGKFLLVPPLEKQPSHNESLREVFMMMNEDWWGWQEKVEGNWELFSNSSFLTR